MKNGWLPLLAGYAMVMGTVTFADTYRYEDADGTLIFTDDPGRVPRNSGNVTITPDVNPGKKQPLPKKAVSPPTAKPVSTRQESPEVSRHSSFYDIGGRTFQDIRREMYSRSPGRRLAGNKVALAWCEWSLGWSIQTVHDGTLCHIDAVNIRLEVTITMPRWVNYGAAPDGMKAAWDTYYQAILKHEETHSDNGIAAAREIQQRLPELSGRYSCKDIQEDGAQLARKILKKYRDKDEAHDRVSLNADMITDVEIAADQREGVFGRHYPERQGAPSLR